MEEVGLARAPEEEAEGDRVRWASGEGRVDDVGGELKGFRGVYRARGFE